MLFGDLREGGEAVFGVAKDATSLVLESASAPN
jgi:hypothetical protein